MQPELSMACKKLRTVTGDQEVYKLHAASYNVDMHLLVNMT